MTAFDIFLLEFRNLRVKITWLRNEIFLKVAEMGIRLYANVSWVH
jgi:hypothetical protein